MGQAKPPKLLFAVGEIMEGRGSGRWVPTEWPESSLLEQNGALDLSCAEGHRRSFSVCFDPTKNTLVALCNDCGGHNEAEIKVS